MKKLSDKNPYSLPHYRTLELKYFCLQYDDWVKEAASLNLYLKEKTPADPTGNLAVKLSWYTSRIDAIKHCCILAGDKEGILLEGVTKGRSYDILEARHGVLPWSRKSYYDCYRRFLFILHSQQMHLI